MSDIKTQLTEDLADVQWSELIPHARRDVVIVVNQSINLIDVALAFANDNSSLVQNWLDENLIGKPSLTQLSSWNAEPEKKFNTLIVQPFVLITPI